MGSNKKRKVGVKTYHRYSPGAFISGIFALALAASLFAFIILPVFTFAMEGESAVIYKGLDVVLLGVRKFYSNVVGDRFNYFLSYFNTYEGDNQLLKIICNFHEYIEMGLIGLYALAAVFAFIEACLGVVWIVGGKLNKPKSTLSLGWAIFIFFGLSIGLFFLYLTFYGEVLKATGEDTTAVFNIYSLLPLGGMFFSLIVLGITHKACFKNRVFADKKHNKNKENNIISDDANVPHEMSSSAPQNAPVAIVPTQEVFLEEPESVIEIPEGTSEIADHAYAKNISIYHIDIPEGVITIGGGAFANCHNLEKITLPKSLKEIGYNTFFDTPKLKNIDYAGTKEDWLNVKRGSNWLTHSGTTIINTVDGPITVNPAH